MWSRQELKEDSKTLVKLNYWPFVLVAFIHALVTGSGGGSAGSSSVRNKDKYEGNISDFLNNPYVVTAAGIIVAVILAGSLIAIALSVFVFAPLEVGCKRYMVLARSEKPQYGEMTFAFHNFYGNVVKTMFLKNLYTFLWSLLFIIPGIVKSYEYRMVPYLMSEYPDMASSEAFRISREMMTGNKWAAFVLDLSFIGWELLGALTIGLVNLFWVNPYKMLTDSGLYLRLKETNPSIS